MRRSTHDVEFLLRKNSSTLYGVKLGWDYVAEHEFGIRGLQKAFGIPGVYREVGNESVGIAARTITSVPHNLHFQSAGGESPYSLLTYHPSVSPDELAHAEYCDRFLVATLRMRMYPDSLVHAAWDDRSFALATATHDDWRLSRLQVALMTKNALIFVGPRQAFANGSLYIIIASAVTNEEREALEANDKKYLDSLE